ncbi:MAG: NAD(P)-dependent oxidoreductase [Phyllobacterium sp.]
MSETIVVLEPLSERSATRMQALLPPGFVLTGMDRKDEDHMAEVIANADYAIASQAPVPARVINCATKLRLIQKWGVGVDNIDVAAAHARNIPVARTTGSNAIPVAEFTLGLILSLCRCIASGHAELRNGVWKGGGQLPIQTMSVTGRTIGIIGFGAIGQVLAMLLRGFGCTILYNKRTPLDPQREQELGVSYAPIETLLRQADIVTLNCPHNAGTAGLINRTTLAMMKPSAILINTARGGIVVESDLVEALRDGVIAAAATDVFEQEPVNVDHPLLSMSNVLVTPHIAASAADSFEPGVRHMFRNILGVSKGEAIPLEDLIA